MGFLSNKVLQSDCSGNSKAGVQLWSQAAESAKVLGKDCFSVLGAANHSIASDDEKWVQQNWFAVKVFSALSTTRSLAMLRRIQFSGTSLSPNTFAHETS